MARPKLEIDADQVYKLAQHGCTVEEIADFFGCSRDTIHGRFSAELSKGKAELRIGLRNWQIASAKKGNVVMQIWLGKQWLGQSDKQEVSADQTINIVIDSDDANL
jgi:AraC-like DNA-binding protein